MVSAGSGDVTANGVQNQVALANQQVAAVDAPTGSGSTAASDTNGSTLDDKGAATGQSGLAAVQTGSLTVQSGGQAAAQSGAASATGLSAQNVVVNGSRAIVQVGGANSGAISIRNANTVLVQDRGAAAANSGGARSSIAPTPDPGTANATNNQASSIASPVADASPASAGVTASGSMTTNTLTSSRSTAIEAAVGTPTAISISQAQNLAAGSQGQATAASAGACAGTGCSAPPTGAADQTPPAVPVPSPAPSARDLAAQARSGAADARGAIVQNVVNTAANVRIQIGGENHGIIQVLINTLTSIFNQGTAVATTGAASANNLPSTLPQPASPVAPDADATSGQSNATGAVVNNDVGLRSSASVQVNGDNRNPINIVLNLTARLFNLGQARATSGDAQANEPTGSVAADSGAASANGLIAQNQVNLGADANVNITGNNYANITVELDFDTAIQNIGQAVATSGQALANSIAPPLSPSTPAVASASQVGSAQGSPPAASAAAQVTAAQAAAAQPTIGDATSSGTVTTDAVAKQLPPPIQADVHSGNGTVVGVDDNVLAVNNQVSVASGTQNTAGTASDSATYTLAACGKASVRTGSTYVNAPADSDSGASLIDPETLCPTPTPTVTPPGGANGGQTNSPIPPSTGSNSSGPLPPAPNDDAKAQQSGKGDAGHAGPFGPMVASQPGLAAQPTPFVQPVTGMHRSINLFGAWPAPDLLLPPAQQVHALPLPRPAMPVVQPAPMARSEPRSIAPAPTASVSLGQIARDAYQASGVRGVNSAVSPFPGWPAANLPVMPEPHMPPRTLPAAVVAVPVAPAGPALSTVLPRMSVPLSSIALLVAVLTAAMALIARTLWQRPAIRAGLLAAYRFVTPRVLVVVASIRRGRAWIARAATLFFVLVLALMQWRR